MYKPHSPVEEALCRILQVMLMLMMAALRLRARPVLPLLESKWPFFFSQYPCRVLETHHVVYSSLGKYDSGLSRITRLVHKGEIPISNGYSEGKHANYMTDLSSRMISPTDLSTKLDFLERLSLIHPKLWRPHFNSNEQIDMMEMLAKTLTSVPSMHLYTYRRLCVFARKYWETRKSRQ